MDALPKPWHNLEDYRAVRLREASYEVEIAEKFLEEGLVRNAAGRAFKHGGLWWRRTRWIRWIILGGSFQVLRG
jgi:hypothetical protein